MDRTFAVEVHDDGHWEMWEVDETRCSIVSVDDAIGEGNLKTNPFILGVALAHELWGDEEGEDEPTTSGQAAADKEYEDSTPTPADLESWTGE
jgi:hypothetical protein